jgi:hypothetical protein
LQWALAIFVAVFLAELGGIDVGSRSFRPQCRAEGDEVAARRIDTREVPGELAVGRAQGRHGLGEVAEPRGQ